MRNRLLDQNSGERCLLWLSNKQYICTCCHKCRSGPTKVAMNDRGFSLIQRFYPSSLNYSTSYGERQRSPSSSSSHSSGEDTEREGTNTHQSKSSFPALVGAKVPDEEAPDSSQAPRHSSITFTNDQAHDSSPSPKKACGTYDDDWFVVRTREFHLLHWLAAVPASKRASHGGRSLRVDEQDYDDPSASFYWVDDKSLKSLTTTIQARLSTHPKGHRMTKRYRPCHLVDLESKLKKLLDSASIPLLSDSIIERQYSKRDYRANPEDADDVRSTGMSPPPEVYNTLTCTTISC